MRNSRKHNISRSCTDRSGSEPLFAAPDAKRVCDHGDPVRTRPPRHTRQTNGHGR